MKNSILSSLTLLILFFFKIIESFAQCDFCQDSACDGNICSACFSGYYLYNGICLSNCPSNTYHSGSICANCTDPNCNSCTQANQCLGCYGGYFLDSGTSCTSCPENCASCSDSNNCDICSPGTYQQGSICVQNCSPGYFSSIVNSQAICQLCPSTCSSCTDSNTCQECQTGFYFQ